jgi:hypothetical protein
MLDTKPCELGPMRPMGAPVNNLPRVRARCSCGTTITGRDPAEIHDRHAAHHPPRDTEEKL